MKTGTLLTPPEIEEVIEAAITCDFADLNSRPLLFGGIPAAYFNQLPALLAPIDVLRSDLLAMNARPRLEGLDAPPLALWLQNASLRAAPRLEAEVFRRLHAQVIERSGGAPSEAQRPQAATSGPPPTQERAPAERAPFAAHPTGPDVLLICALKDEYDQALLVADGLLEPWVEHTDGPRGWIYARAIFASPTGPLVIHATWATHMGREQAGAVISLFLEAQAPRCLAMSGICAGRRGDVSLGDVIFADRLYGYDAGKTVVEDGKARFRGDMRQYRPRPEAWIQRMHQVRVDAAAPWLGARPALPLEDQEYWVLERLLADENPRQHALRATDCPDWAVVLKRLWKRGWLEDKKQVLTEAGRAEAEQHDLLHPDGRPPPAGFRVHVAPIATGAEVIEDAGIFPRLSESMRKVLGIDMEAAGVAAVADIHDLPVLVAKAASDHGDPFKDDRYRHFGARAAAECLIGLLRQGADLLPGRAAPQARWVAKAAPRAERAGGSSAPPAGVERLARVRKRITQLLRRHPAVARLLRAAFEVDDDAALVDALLGHGPDVVDTCIEALAALDEHLDPQDLQALDEICQVLLPVVIDLRHCVVRTPSGHFRAQVRTETLAELIMAEEDGRDLWVNVPRDPEAELVAAARIPTPSTTLAPFFDLDGHLLRQNLVGAVAEYFKCPDQDPKDRAEYAKAKLESRAKGAGRRYLALQGSEARMQVVETIINEHLPGLALVHLAGGGINYKDEVYLVDRLGILLRRLRPEARS